MGEAQLMAAMGSIYGRREQEGKRCIDIYGTTGNVWFIYKLSSDRKVYRSDLLDVATKNLMTWLVYIMDCATRAMPSASVEVSTSSLANEVEEEVKIRDYYW